MRPEGAAFNKTNKKRARQIARRALLKVKPLGYSPLMSIFLACVSATGVLGSPDFYKKDPAAITATAARLEELKQHLQTTCARWEEPEELQS